MTRKSGEITQSALLTTALRLFVQGGYHGTSMRDIADALGVAVSGIYNHFADKEQIFLAILQNSHPFRRLTPLLERDIPAEGLLKATMHHLAADYETHPELLKLLLIEIVEFNGRHIPALFEALSPQIIALTERIQMSEPHLRPTTPFLLFRSLVGTVFAHFISGELLNRAYLDTDELGSLDDFINLFLYGVKDST
jgi:AcrR family transcriptional regulator